MSCFVIAYPKISQSDYDWIQSIRREYDLRQFSVVKPHITFVFATQKPKAALIEHVRTKLSKTKAFNVRLASAKVVEDDSKTYFHVFLVPDIGFDELNDLHDLLYTGALQSERREDIPFIPHLGVGNNQNRGVMDKLADNLNADKRRIRGRVDDIAVVELDGRKVVDLVKVPLI